MQRREGVEEMVEGQEGRHVPGHRPHFLAQSMTKLKKDSNCDHLHLKVLLPALCSCDGKYSGRSIHMSVVQQVISNACGYKGEASIPCLSVSTHF